MDSWDSEADERAEAVHLIDRFEVEIPEKVSNCVDQFNLLTVQGQHGIGILTLAYSTLTTDPNTSHSSADASTFSTSCPIPTSKINSYLINNLITYYRL